MSWHFDIVLCAYLLFFYGAFRETGFFRAVGRWLNPEPRVDPSVTPGDLTLIRSDIEKLKLALNLKEFKR